MLPLSPPAGTREPKSVADREVEVDEDSLVCVFLTVTAAYGIAAPAEVWADTWKLVN